MVAIGAGSMLGRGQPAIVVEYAPIGARALHIGASRALAAE
jgi:hypothetical protein